MGTAPGYGRFPSGGFLCPQGFQAGRRAALSGTYCGSARWVKKGQVIGIVEAMKLMNEIESDYDGVVTDILVDNEQMVEYGQPMFVIKPV